MSVSGKGARAKGHNWEREVAIKFREIYPNAARGLSQVRDGSDVPDVDGTPFWIECKVGKAPNVRGAVQQACVYCLEKQDPRPILAITKQDHESPLVTMFLPTLLAILAENEKLKAALANGQSYVDYLIDKKA